MIRLQLGRGAAADTVDLTISRMPHPAMPDGVLADVITLAPGGVHRVCGVGCTPQEAVDRVRAHLAARR